MIGEAPTYYLTQAGTPLAGSGITNKGFNREGFVGQFYFGQHVDLQVVTQHGKDNEWFGAGYGAFADTGLLNNSPGTTLPAGSRAPTWNGVMVETHYVYSPQLIFIQRSEWQRMSQQALASLPSSLGNSNMYTFGFRYMPIMTSRAGFAWHNEYSWFRSVGTAPDGSDLTSSALLSGFDFDF